MQRLTNTLRLGGVVALASVMLAGCGNAADPKTSPSPSNDRPLAGRTMVIASWGGDWTKSTKEFFFDPFAADTGVKLVIETPGKDFAKHVTEQQDAGKVTWDLLDTPSSDTTVLTAAKRLERFPDDLVSAIKPLVTDHAINPSPEEAYYLLNGQVTDLVVCNPKMVTKCPTNPVEFFDVQNFPGKRGITMGGGLVAAMFALEADGVTADKMFPLDIARAERKLRSLGDNLVIAKTSVQSKAIYNDGTVGINFMSEGAAYRVKKDKIPETQMFWNGALMVQEGFCVVRDAPNKDVAFAFLKWFAEHPEQQAKFTTATHHMTPARDLIQRISPDIVDTLPVGKPGVVLMDGQAAAPYADEIAAMVARLVGN